MSEVVEVKQKELWQKAFPLAGFEPLLEPVSDEDEKLAKMFCPQLHVYPKLFEKERQFLRKRLTDPVLAESFFLSKSGIFPDKDLTGARIYLLNKLHSELNRLNDYQKLWAEMPVVAEKTCNLELYKRLKSEYLKTSQDKINNERIRLFDEQFPIGEPTCVIKYRVVKSKVTPNLWCIQYFVYWPVQLFPFHIPDYEPIYIFVGKEDNMTEDHFGRFGLERYYGSRFQPLLIIFNANPASILTQIKPLFSARGPKRPGHLIRTFINWDSRIRKSEILPSQFNDMADSMTKSFGGSYCYQKIKNFKDSHVDQLFRINEERFTRPQFFVYTTWHAYDTAKGLSARKLGSAKAFDCDLQPLKAQDLVHIEWDIRNPFEAPFLYPVVGKDLMMHTPFNMDALYGNSKNDRRYIFARRLKKPSMSELYKGFPIDSKANDYCVGLMVKLLNELEGKVESPDLWDMIETFAYRRYRFSIWNEYETSLDTAIKKYSDPVAYRLRGMWGSESKKAKENKAPFAEAIEDYNHAVKIDPLDPISYFLLGKEYSKSDYTVDLQKSFDSFHRVIELDPNNAEAYIRCSIFYDHYNYYDASSRCLELAIELDPERTMEYIESSIKDHPSNATTYKNRGICYRVQGKFNAAIEDFNRAIELDQKNSQAFAFRGSCYSALNPPKLESALSDLNNALSLTTLETDDSKDCYYSALYNKACCLSRMGLVEEALAALREIASAGLNESWKEGAKEDSDFENLRNDKRFSEIIKPSKQP